MIYVITTFIITILSIILGYYIGKKDRLPELPKNTFPPFNISPSAWQQGTDKKLGAFNEPTAKEIFLNEHPEVKAEMEQMEEVFKNSKV